MRRSCDNRGDDDDDDDDEDEDDGDEDDGDEDEDEADDWRSLMVLDGGSPKKNVLIIQSLRLFETF